VLQLNATAKEVIRDILEASPLADGAGVRLSTAAVDEHTEELSLLIVEGPTRVDEIIEEDGVRIFLDEDASLYLADKVMTAERSGPAITLSFHPAE